MKIEKISENQIRCTLSRDDLVDRELRISELAYGSEKAKALFRDMMQQANYEFGFEAEDIPLMIEAIPVSPECLILVITKVEDPDELDTRFSKFSPDADSGEESYEEEAEDESYADEIINCFGQMDELLGDSTEDNKDDFVPLTDALSPNTEEEPEESTAQKSVSIQTNLLKIYSFHTLNEVIKLSNVLFTYYKGINSLYKNPVNSMYYLVISKSDHTPEEFNKICNIASEYGKPERTTYASPYYYQEHFETIVKDNAIQILSVM
jgi:adapter protein MecA 1/2